MLSSIKFTIEIYRSGVNLSAFDFVLIKRAVTDRVSDSLSHFENRPSKAVVDGGISRVTKMK
eukprot:jgi/Picsp_1/6315/NSC_03664-R1_---NA---